MKKSGKENFDESDANEEDWENDWEEEYKREEEKVIVSEGLPLLKERGKNVLNVCFIKIRSKLSSVLLLCLLRIFMKQTLLSEYNLNLLALF